MMNVLNVTAMNLHKQALINRRDELLEHWLDNYDKLQKWKVNGKKMMVCKNSKQRDHAQDVIKILEAQLKQSSINLRILDAEITGMQDRRDNYYSILETY